MPVRFTCPNPDCACELMLKDELAGKKVKCPRCGKILTESKAAEKADPLVGKKFAHYQIVSKIGEGGMGAVYKAKNVRLNKVVALKMVSTRLVKKDPTFLERFIREAQAAAQLEHPNVVTVHYVGNEADHYFIEMQYVEGNTARDLLSASEDVTPMEATSIAIEAAKALSAAHAKGIIHRDVKPDNIMITVEGTIKVADFGLAGLAGQGEARTGSGLVLGTPYYMSPEQCRGAATDARSDIYSLGATYYHLLTGSPPFHGESHSNVVRLHISGPVPSPQELRPDLPSEVERIVRKMMAKDPAERYQACDDLLRDLQNAAQLIANIDAGIQPAAQPSRRRALAAVGIAVLFALLMVGAGVGILLMSGYERKSEAPVPKPVAREPVAPAPKEEPDQPKPPDAAKPPSTAEKPKPAEKPPSSPEDLLNADGRLKREPTDREPTTREPAAAEPKPAREERDSGAEPRDAGREPQTADRPKPAETKTETEETAAPAPLDTAAYASAIGPIDRLVDERKYDPAIMETNVVAVKIKGAEDHIRLKRANIERLKRQWAEVKAQVNGGKVTLAMKDICPKYSYAGDLAAIDDSGLTAKKGKVQLAIKWDRITKEEELALRKRCAPPKDAESAQALFAFCCEGTERLFERAEGFLGAAAEYGVDIKPLIDEVTFVRKLPAPSSATKKAEAEPTEGQEQKTETAEAKEQAATQEAKSEDKKAEEEKAKPYAYRDECKQVYHCKLDNPKQLLSSGIQPPDDVKFAKGAKSGALVLARERLRLPMRLPADGGLIEFMLKASGERVDFGFLTTRPFAAAQGQGRQTLWCGVYNSRLGIWFPSGGQGEEQGGRQQPLTCQQEFPWDEWVTIAVEWGDEGRRLYVNGVQVSADEESKGFDDDIGEVHLSLQPRGADGRMVRRNDPMPKITVLVDELSGYVPKRRSKK